MLLFHSIEPSSSICFKSKIRDPKDRGKEGHVEENGCVHYFISWVQLAVHRYTPVNDSVSKDKPPYERKKVHGDSDL